MIYKIEINILKSNLGNSYKNVKNSSTENLLQVILKKQNPQNQIKFKSTYEVLIIYPVPYITDCELGKVCSALQQSFLSIRNEQFCQVYKTCT